MKLYAPFGFQYALYCVFNVIIAKLGLLHPTTILRIRDQSGRRKINYN